MSLRSAISLIPRQHRASLLGTCSLEGILLAVQGVLALSSGYLLLLLLAARDSARSPTIAPSDHAGTRLRIVILIPAHDERDGIQATLASVASCSYPADRRRTIVVADNCTDDTADCARMADVEVWERDDRAKLGKGFALAWALQQLQADDDFDAVAVLDADCLASPNMLSAMEECIGRGASAVQVSYVVANPGASHASALRFAGFALMNTVRPLGKQRLGLSCGLSGSGMAFTKELLRRVPWDVAGLTEDAEYHLRIVEGGGRVEFVPDAWVSSSMPTSLGRSASQQARWENGKLELVRHWSGRLVASGLAEQDMVRLHAGLEWLVPPQSLIAAGSVGSWLAGRLLDSRRLMSLSAGTLAAQLVFVLMGLRLVHAPMRVYRALLVAPVLIARKIALYVRLLGGRGPTSWVRTEREAPVTAGRAR